MGKHVLVVYAHWSDLSFNHALLAQTRLVLEEQGHVVEVSDLYKMGFNPVVSMNDITGDPESEHLLTAMGAAVHAGTLAPDIRCEQEKLVRADLVVFHFPITWGALPAILKGWCDRVISPNFAYSNSTGEVLDNGKMKTKRAVVCLTTGAGRLAYSARGILGDIATILWPIQNVTLGYVGFEVLKPQINYAPGSSDETARKDMLRQWGERLRNLFQEEPIRNTSLRHYDFQAGMILTDTALEELGVGKGSQYGLSVAQHLGKIPPS